MTTIQDQFAALRRATVDAQFDLQSHAHTVHEAHRDGSEWTAEERAESDRLKAIAERVQAERVAFGAEHGLDKPVECCHYCGQPMKRSRRTGRMYCEECI